MGKGVDDKVIGWQGESLSGLSLGEWAEQTQLGREELGIGKGAGKIWHRVKCILDRPVQPSGYYRTSLV